MLCTIGFVNCFLRVPAACLLPCCQGMLEASLREQFIYITNILYNAFCHVVHTRCLFTCIFARQSLHGHCTSWLCQCAPKFPEHSDCNGKSLSFFLPLHLISSPNLTHWYNVRQIAPSLRWSKSLHRRRMDQRWDKTDPHNLEPCCPGQPARESLQGRHLCLKQSWTLSCLLCRNCHKLKVQVLWIGQMSWCIFLKMLTPICRWTKGGRLTSHKDMS